ncbi:MAG: glycosyltransferase family 4 protein [Oscillospiraceae bacterium]
MKILVVCQYYYPENFQITPICESLTNLGHNVTVLTGLPNYPTGIIPDEYKKQHHEETINGVHVIRTFEIGRKKGIIHLALNYLSYMISSLHKIKKLDNDFDLVFVYQLSPVLMGLAGRKYSKRNSTPLFLYCCDLWPESMKIYLKNEKSLAFRFIKSISKKVYSSADYIAVQSKSFINYLHSVHGIPENQIMYFPAFADESYLEFDFTPTNSVTDFVFLGNIGIAQNLSEVINAVEKIRNIPNFQVHIVGDGSYLQVLKNEVKNKELENIVKFYGRRSVDEMNDFYKLADACLISLKTDDEVGLTLPSKMQGYMAAGKPIIGMINGSAQDVINESHCGICVSADDTDGFAVAMKDFIENKDNYRECGTNGRNYFIRNFRKSIFMEKLENKMKELRKS